MGASVAGVNGAAALHRADRHESAHDTAVAFLAQLPDSTWGRCWDVRSPVSRDAAATWLVSVFADFEAFLDRTDR